MTVIKTTIKLNYRLTKQDLLVPQKWNSTQFTTIKVLLLDKYLLQRLIIHPVCLTVFFLTWFLQLPLYITDEGQDNLVSSAVCGCASLPAWVEGRWFVLLTDRMFA